MVIQPLQAELDRMLSKQLVMESFDNMNQRFSHINHLDSRQFRLLEHSLAGYGQAIQVAWVCRQPHSLHAGGPR